MIRRERVALWPLENRADPGGPIAQEEFSQPQFQSSAVRSGSTSRQQNAPELPIQAVLVCIEETNTEV